MEQIAEWLGKLGMSEYAERFAENRIDFAVLPDLTDQDLKDIGVVLGDRRKILRAIARLDAAREAVVLEPKPPVTLSFAAAEQGLPIEAISCERADVTEEVDRDAGGRPPRTDYYYRLVARAMKGLESTAEARQVIYERARKALIAHLRFNQPALSKAVIVKERFALEDAIRKIEAGAARQSRREVPTEPQSATSSVGMPDYGGASEPPQRDEDSPVPADMLKEGWPAVLSMRRQPLSGRSSLETRPAKGFRDVVDDFGTIPALAAQTRPQVRELRHEEEEVEPVFNREDFNWPEFDIREGRDFELPDAPHVRATPGTALDATRRSISYSGLATLVVALTMVIGSVAVAFWQWSAITEFYQLLSYTGLKLQDQANHKTSSAQPKLSGRVPQQQRVLRSEE